MRFCLGEQDRDLRTLGGTTSEGYGIDSGRGNGIFLSVWRR